MKTITLEAHAWTSPDDFYDALLPQLGAPEWHGRNLDALDDSIFSGDINAVEPPFRVQVTQTDCLTDEMKHFLRRVERVFVEGAGQADATISFSPPI